MPGRIRPVELGVNPLIGMIPNLTGHEILLKLGVIHRDDTQFDQAGRQLMSVNLHPF